MNSPVDQAAELPAPRLDGLDHAFTDDTLSLDLRAKPYTVAHGDGVSLANQARSQHAPNRTRPDLFTVVDIGEQTAHGHDDSHGKLVLLAGLVVRNDYRAPTGQSAFAS